MPVDQKIFLLWQACDPEFAVASFVAPVETSGSYAKKVRRLARYGRLSDADVTILCQVVDDFRRFVMIVDDVVDEDEIRNNAPSFWTRYGIDQTIAQGSWYFKKAVEAATHIGCGDGLKVALYQMACAVDKEIEYEDPYYVPEDMKADYLVIVKKETAFRVFLAQALGCSQAVIDAMYWDGFSGQVLDDALSSLSPKDGREENSDERLGRLTYMSAFEVSAEDAILFARQLKTIVSTIIQSQGENT
ncbi:MAG: hypothetical protein COV44_10585 [Deltaproteobacteria bacterium CG11_big_fil_rev_8_21_14_0_20_45_16]|nr:MAG: hypothetical protein COV44_10585 [Deltaproteobacteria bacterium CG11_big_fil_rev_8_21_14_0_20_45_16]